MDNPVAANILGTAGAVCWSIQLLPQIWKNYRRHSTEGLNPLMYSSWAVAGIPLGTYNLVQNLNIALQVQPQVLIFLSLVTWAQCKYYGDQWGILRLLMIGVPAGLLIGGIEAGLFFALRHGRSVGVEWPLTLMAVLAAVFLAIGVLRYYWEIYKSRSVEGISFMFVLIDAGGDLVSILALLFSPRIDIVGMVVYSVELVLWIGIGILGGYYRFLPWTVRLARRGIATRSTEGTAVKETGQSPTDSEQGTVIQS